MLPTPTTTLASMITNLIAADRLAQDGARQLRGEASLPAAPDRGTPSNGWASGSNPVMRKTIQNRRGSWSRSCFPLESVMPTS